MRAEISFRLPVLWKIVSSEYFPDSFYDQLENIFDFSRSNKFMFFNMVLYLIDVQSGMDLGCKF